jgi:hypothetical protein
MLRESGGVGGPKFADDLLVAIDRQLVTLHLQTGDKDSTGLGEVVISTSSRRNYQTAGRTVNFDSGGDPISPG